MDCSPPGSSVHGIFQARILEWVPLPSPTDSAGINKYLLSFQYRPHPVFDTGPLMTKNTVLALLELTVR